MGCLRGMVLVVPGWESFHLLVPEVTLNDPADASGNVWAEQNPPPWGPAAPFSLTTNNSLEPEQSRELFRATDPGTGVMTRPASQESFWLLPGSPDHVSVLDSPSIKADVGLLATAPPPTSDAPVANRAQPGGPVRGPEDGSSLWDSEEPPGPLQDLDHERGILEQSQITLVSLTDTSDPEETLPDEAAPRGDELLQTVPREDGRSLGMIL